MNELASMKLIRRAEPYSRSKTGLSAETIARVPVTEDYVQEIAECLGSDDAAELKWGLWFAQGILDATCPQGLLQLLVAKLPEWMRHPVADIRATALPLLIRLRDNLPGYRDLMLQCLKDTNPEVRTQALVAYQTFLTEGDIPRLLELKDDSYMTETSMGSPLVYSIRNQALAVIESLCHKQFSKSEKVEALADGLTVYWWDWPPFLESLEKRRSKWRFW